MAAKSRIAAVVSQYSENISRCSSVSVIEKYSIRRNLVFFRFLTTKVTTQFVLTSELKPLCSNFRFQEMPKKIGFPG